MVWYLYIFVMVVVGIGIIIGIWLKLLESERGGKLLGLYTIATILLLLLTTVLTHRLFVNR